MILLLLYTTLSFTSIQLINCKTRHWTLLNAFFLSYYKVTNVISFQSFIFSLFSDESILLLVFFSSFKHYSIEDLIKIDFRIKNNNFFFTLIHIALTKIVLFFYSSHCFIVRYFHIKML